MFHEVAASCFPTGTFSVLTAVGLNGLVVFNAVIGAEKVNGVTGYDNQKSQHNYSCNFENFLQFMYLPQGRGCGLFSFLFKSFYHA